MCKFAAAVAGGVGGVVVVVVVVVVDVDVVRVLCYPNPDTWLRNGRKVVTNDDELYSLSFACQPKATNRDK